mgnify:CR=1 FL=1
MRWMLLTRVSGDESPGVKGGRQERDKGGGWPCGRLLRQDLALRFSAVG